MIMRCEGVESLLTWLIMYFANGSSIFASPLQVNGYHDRGIATYLLYRARRASCILALMALLAIPRSQASLLVDLQH